VRINGFQALLIMGALASGGVAAGEPAGQQERGEDIYFSSCAECHNADLSGGAAHAAPPLVGSAFMKNWLSHNARELLERVRLTMPSSQPQSLSAQAYLDVVAFVLKRNGIAPCDGVLTEPCAARVTLQ
jgi:mono/diheme cytochrome c family protein